MAGSPARIARSLSADEIAWRNNGHGEYQRLAKRALGSLCETAPLTEMEPNRPRNRENAIPVRLGRNTQNEEARDGHL
ncbi:hypothetical protein [Gymnodinialimonas sp. 57CJ19]|uniref:hypothetical protein n=1 Tax=Gymnodinialimonas sp. 57CJ19 TaxID=3138498 RepID=UPI00313448DF